MKAKLERERVMPGDPSWTWRLRGAAADRRHVRLWYGLLAWCTDSHSLIDRLVSFLSLVFGIGSLAMYFINTRDDRVAICVVSIVAALIALKGLVAHVTKVLFRQKTLIGGAPTADQFENLVPQGAKQVALVGQNLADRLDEWYDFTLQGLRTLLKRKNPAVDEIWLVLQTPLALFSVDPKAARHLESKTLPRPSAPST